MTPEIVLALIGLGGTVLGALGYGLRQILNSFLSSQREQTAALLKSLEDSRAANAQMVEAMVGLRIDVDEIRRRQEITDRQVDAIYSQQVEPRRPSEFGKERQKVETDAEARRRERLERKDQTLKTRRATGS